MRTIAANGIDLEYASNGSGCEAANPMCCRMRRTRYGCRIRATWRSRLTDFWQDTRSTID